jgi:hypothetical protein
MPLFRCAKCGCVENTALGNYWWNTQHEGKPAWCSECDTGTWHGRFPKKDARAEGYKLGADGFLYKPSEMEGPNRFTHTTIVGDP